jgi:hypothetical protein
MRIPRGTLPPGKAVGDTRKTQGKIIPMVRILYTKAEYGDMTRTSPDAFRVKTSGLAVAVAIAVLLWFEQVQMLVDSMI